MTDRETPHPDDPDAAPGRDARELVAAESGRAGRGATVGVLDRVCTVAVREVLVDGAAVSLVNDDASDGGVVASSDPLSSLLAELQFTAGEGPCIDACVFRRPVLEAVLDDAAQRRWPGYAPQAMAWGVQAVFAFPLQVGASRLGVLDLYRSRPGQLAGTAVALGLSLARVAVRALLDGQQSAAAGEAPLGIDDALDYRVELYQAQGMVMVDLGISLPEALSRIRAHAYAHDRRLLHVAQDIVSGVLRLEHDDPTDRRRPGRRP